MGNTCQTGNTDWENRNDTIPWNISVIEQDSVSDHKPVYRFEVIHNGQYIASIKDMTIDQALKEIQPYYEAAGLLDEYKLILLNDNFSLFFLETEGREEISQENEIKFSFRGKQFTDYQVKIIPRVHQVYHIVYIETSGGNQYLKDLKKKADEMANSGSPFIIYFKAPGGGMIVTEQDRLSNLYNMVFSSITQPPFAQLELDFMTKLIKEKLSDHQAHYQVSISFYITEIAYTRMHEDFVRPLIGLLRDNENIVVSEVNVITDFDVSEKLPYVQYRSF